MDALLFAFLLTLALDQGDRAQRLTLALAVRHASPWRLAPIVGAVILSSALLACAGAWIGSYLSARPRLLFLALAMLAGAVGFFLPSFLPLRQGGLLGSAPALAGRLLIARLNGRAGFGLLGFATFSGDPVGVAAGGLLGGLTASFLALSLGAPYFAFVERLAVRLTLGGVLLAAGLPLALSALGLF